jgi:RNAse (barnase) inhibitor barstar
MVFAELVFEYTDQPDANCGPEDFLLRVPAAIRTKAELLVALADAGQFPDYFGSNWDALLDCLRDLSWIANRRVVIVHGDLPLRDDQAECGTYLGILRAAVADWAKGVRSAPAEPPPGWPYVDHELRIVFPAWVSADVARFLAAET